MILYDKLIFNVKQVLSKLKLAKNRLTRDLDVLVFYYTDNVTTKATQKHHGYQHFPQIHR